MQGFGSRFISSILGVPLSALHYWDRTNLLKPSVRPAAGRGTRRLYSFRDLTQLLIASRLRAIGLPLGRIRRCLAFLRSRLPQAEAPLAAESFVTDGESVFLFTDDPEQMLSALREHLVWSVPLGAWVREAQETVAAALAPRLETLTVDGHRFTVTMEQDPEDGWWVGLVEGLPGCGSQGSTLAELREMVSDAIHEYLAARGDVVADAPQAATALAV